MPPEEPSMLSTCIKGVTQKFTVSYFHGGRTTGHVSKRITSIYNRVSRLDFSCMISRGVTRGRLVGVVRGFLEGLSSSSESVFVEHC